MGHANHPQLRGNPPRDVPIDAPERSPRGDSAAARGAAATRTAATRTAATPAPAEKAAPTPSRRISSTASSKPTLRSIATDERRARLGIRHHLATKASGVTPADLVDDLVALHATDPASVFLSAAARIGAFRPDDLADALYTDRTLVRMLGMRRTMFVVPTGSASVVQHSSSDAVAARLRRALVKDLATGTELSNVTSDPAIWLAELDDSVIRLLRELGESTAIELSRTEPRLRTQLTYAEGKAYGGPANITSRVLNLLSAEGRIVRGRPAGGWFGSQYKWSPIEKWLPDGVPTLSADDARAQLVRRWLTRFGPGTMADIVWWTGWNLGDTRRAVAANDTALVGLDGDVGVVLASDLEPVAAPPPWIALLPALDPSPMGWSGRDWYISPDFRPALFDKTGNIGPTVWCDGRIVGGWAQRSDGAVVWRFLENIGATATSAVEAEAERLTEWLKGMRVIPKFRTPLEKELSAAEPA